MEGDKLIMTQLALDENEKNFWSISFQRWKMSVAKTVRRHLLICVLTL